MKRLDRSSAMFAVIILSIVGSIAPANAAPKTPASSVTWNGNGTYVDGEGSRLITNSVCGMANGAPVDGDYVLFVLASTKTISNATIKFGDQSPLPMIKSNTDKRGTSSYKYFLEGTTDLASLYSAGVASYYSSSGTPTLNIGQGCQETPSLSITFLGELTTGPTFGALGSVSATGQTITICETPLVQPATNCVTFNAGDAANTVKNLILSDSNSHSLDVTILPAGIGQSVYFHNISVSATNAGQSITDSYTGVIIGTQSNNSYANGDSLWIHSEYTGG